MDLSRTSTTNPSEAGVERSSAFTPTHSGAAQNAFAHHLASLRLLPHFSEVSQNRNGQMSDPTAAYNALAAANLIASLAAGNQSMAGYLYGLNAAPSTPFSFGLPPRVSLANSAFSPSASNPVLKELISASARGNNPSAFDPRRQSPDTTTAPCDMSHARAAINEGLLHQRALVPSPGLPDSASLPRASAAPAVTSADVMCPPTSLKDCLGQLSVQVPSGALSSGPNSQISAGIIGKDGRYLERRKRNNEAAKRCRANRRALFEYRFKRSQELELENADLKNQISKLRMELSSLQDLIKARGIKIEPPEPPAMAPAPPVNHPPPPTEPDHESGHESDFSSCNGSDQKKSESVAGWSTPSPESGVVSPTDHHSPNVQANDEH